MRVGLGACLGAPSEPFVSFGLAGALTDELAAGELVTALRVVDERGRTLWEGEPVALPRARPVVVCGAGAVVDGAPARRALAERTGADVVDLETAPLAGSPHFRGAVRAVSDTPAHGVGRLARAAHRDGAVAWTAVAYAVATAPVGVVRVARDARRALAELERAAAFLGAVEEADVPLGP